jgi:hypothetical protein
MKTALFLLAAALALAGAVWAHGHTVTRAAEPPAAGEIRMVPARVYRPLWGDPLAAVLTAIVALGIAFAVMRAPRRS